MKKYLFSASPSQQRLRQYGTLRQLNIQTFCRNLNQRSLFLRYW